MNANNVRIVIAALLALVVWASAGDARAEQVQYLGVHPGETDDAFCYIEVPHVHVYAPKPKHRKTLYVVHDDAYHFVGDPVGHSFDGDKFSYYGHHPVHVDVHVDLGPDAFDDEYCYINGPHYHHYAPPPEIAFELKGGAYWYVGKYSPRYRKHKRARAKINVVYEPIVYTRPVVLVEARPAAYVGPIVEVHADVHADVEVHVPVPSIEIGIGLPGVIIDTHHHHRHHKHRKFKKFKRHKHKHKRGRGRRH